MSVHTDVLGPVKIDCEDPVYISFLHQNIDGLRKANILCDATFVIDDKEIRAHKVILAAASPYFQVMFTTNLVDTADGKIVLQDIQYDTLEQIINFFYSSHIEISDENVYRLMDMADMLQVYPLRHLCSHFLAKSMTTENCISTYECARLHDYKELKSEAFRFICRNFWAVLDNEEFQMTSVETLLSILDSTMLGVGDEGDVFQGVMRWVKYDQASRLGHLDSLVAKIDMNSVPMEILIAVKSDLDLVDTSLPSQAVHTLSATLDQRYESSASWGSWRDSCMQWRRYNQEREVVLLIGGQTETGFCRYMECNVLGIDTWKRLVPRVVGSDSSGENSVVMPLMNQARKYAAHAHSDYEVYVIGGRDETVVVLSHVEMFSIKTHSWTQLCSLPCAVMAPAAALMGDQLYVVGGMLADTTISSSAWVYDKTADRWRDLPSMNEPRAFASCACVNGYVYALGGCRMINPLASVERYDPTTRRWYNVAPMKAERMKMGCVAIDEFIYVIGGMGVALSLIDSVERYNTLTNEWTSLQPMSSPRCSFGATVCGGRIYCLGGLQPTGPQNTAEKYNPASDRWQPVTSFCVPRHGHGATTLCLPLVSPSPI